MNGFGPFVAPFVWFKLYWAAWALLLGVVAILFWVRGRELGMRRRLATARARFTGPVGAHGRRGGRAHPRARRIHLLQHERPERVPHGATRRDAPQAEYERRYGRFEDVAAAGHHRRGAARRDLSRRAGRRPARHVPAREPDRRADRLGARVSSIRTSTRGRSRSTARPGRWSMDAETGYRIFALERALAPGDSMQLSFDVGVPAARLPERRDPDRRGRQRHLLRPADGCRSSAISRVFELSDDEARKRYGLPPQPPMPGTGRRRGEAVRRGLRGTTIACTSRRSSARPPIRSRSCPACCAGAGRRTAAATSTTGPTRRRHSAPPSSRRSTRCVEDRWNDVAAPDLPSPAAPRQPRPDDLGA